MNVVGRVSSFISQGMYSVATPFHPFGGAVDIIVVKQHDGTFRSTPWYVRFGKFQGVLKGAEKLVKIEVNGVEANFHMHLDNSGEAYFVREVDSDGLKDSDNLEVKREDSVENEYNNLDMDRIGRDDSDSGRMFYDFQDEESSLVGSLEFSEYGSNRYDSLDSVEHALEREDSNSEVVLVSVDGHILTAPISKRDCDKNVDLDTPQFHLGPGEGTEYLDNLDNESACKELGNENVCVENSGTQESSNNCSSSDLKKDEAFKSCLDLSEMSVQLNNGDQENMGVSAEDVENMGVSAEDVEKSPGSPLRNGENGNCDRELGTDVECSRSEHSAPCAGDGIEDMDSDLSTKLEISLCGNLLQAGMGSHAAENTFNANLISPEEFKIYSASIVKDENLIVRLQGKYLKWDKAAHIILGMAAFGLDIPVEPKDTIPVEVEKSEAKEYYSEMPSTPSRRWRLWPIPFRKVKTIEHADSNASNEEISVDSEADSVSQPSVSTPTARVASQSPRKKTVRTNVPTTDQIASLNLKEGQNMVNFIFSTRVLGTQKVEAHIYLWRWNTRIVISDVDGTITKSDVLGQFMPLVGRDWTHSGIARLFSAIKENGYQLLFLSARAIVQAYLTKSFLFNLKQDGKSLPNGPVVISPDGLFPSLYREVIRRAPHEFKIACLEDIKALFPSDYNPFYAGFGNRDTDELSYRRIGIPKGKIFIINPQGEVAINNRIDVKSYTSLHTLVHDMFPPTSLVEQEDFNSWNYWKMPLPDIDSL